MKRKRKRVALWGVSSAPVAMFSLRNHEVDCRYCFAVLCGRLNGTCRVYTNYLRICCMWITAGRPVVIVIFVHRKKKLNEEWAKFTCAYNKPEVMHRT